MATRLLEECLRMPAIRRELRISDLESTVVVRDRRERDELGSNASRMQYEGQKISRQDRASAPRKAELERSILDLKRQLKQETVKQDICRTLVKRVQQSRLPEAALSRAALSERDTLVQEVLKMFHDVQDVETELDFLDDSLSQLIRRAEVREQQDHTRKRQKVETEKMLKLKSERAALRRVFFALIMESGVDWLNDEILMDIVLSNR